MGMVATFISRHNKDFINVAKKHSGKWNGTQQNSCLEYVCVNVKEVHFTVLLTVLYKWSVILFC